MAAAIEADAEANEELIDDVEDRSQAALQVFMGMDAFAKLIRR